MRQTQISKETLSVALPEWKASFPLLLLSAWSLSNPGPKAFLPPSEKDVNILKVGFIAQDCFSCPPVTSESAQHMLRGDHPTETRAL